MSCNYQDAGKLPRTSIMEPQMIKKSDKPELRLAWFSGSECMGVGELHVITYQDQSVLLQYVTGSLSSSLARAKHFNQY